MFTDDGKPSDDDPRESKLRLGDERTTLVESLRCQRLTLELKCAGLDAEALAGVPSSPRRCRSWGWYDTSPRGSVRRSA